MNHDNLLTASYILKIWIDMQVMKRVYFIFYLMLWLVCQMYSQVQWTKSPDNLILIKSLNLYEGNAIGSPSVIDEGDTLKMLYAAGGTDTKGRISYAYSLDGISWTKYNHAVPVFDVGTGNAWDSHFIDTPDWLKDHDGYKMYYFGDSDNLSVSGAIGLANSTDGIQWTRYGNQPVLSPGNPGEWDGLFIESPSVLYDGTTYYMWYSGIDTTWRVAIGAATSLDGITWTKYAGNPVISTGNLYSWEGYSVAVPAVILRNNQFEMWYCGVSYMDVLDNQSADTLKIGYATSPDGITWAKYTGNPVMNTYDPPYSLQESRGPWVPDIIYRPLENRFYMWYETAYGFGLATSTPTLHTIFPAEVFTDEIRVYPNPAAEILSIEIMPAFSSQQVEVLFYDIFGRQVLTKFIVPGAQKEIDVSSLAKGMYELTFLVNRVPFGSRKIIIRKP